jgi:hypothetical protein
MKRNVVLFVVLLLIVVIIFSFGKITGYAIFDTDSQVQDQLCMEDCIALGCNPGDSICMESNSINCGQECGVDVVLPVIEDWVEECMQECVFDGCDESDFQCQDDNVEKCDVECSDAV